MRDTIKNDKYINEQIAQALRENNFNRLKQLLWADTININDILDQHGNTALHYAIVSGDKNIIAFLLSKGTNVNIKNNDGDTPLDKIGDYNHIYSDEIIALLLAQGAAINSKNNKLFFWAIKHKNEEILNQYLNNGFDINIKTKDGKNGLDVAIENPDPHIIDILLERGITPNFKNIDLWFWAITNAKLNIIKDFLTHNNTIKDTCDYNNNNNGLHHAVEQSNIIRKTLTELQARTWNTATKTAQAKELAAAQKAAVSKAWKTVNDRMVLVQEAAQKTKNEETRAWKEFNDATQAAQKAATQARAAQTKVDKAVKQELALSNTEIKLHDYLEVINYLIHMGVNINKMNHQFKIAKNEIQAHISKTLFTIKTFSPALTSLLKIFPTALNAQNKFGDSPLMHQIRNRNLTMINYLLDNGANINLWNNNDDNAFTLCLKFLPQEATIQERLFSQQVAQQVLKGAKEQKIAGFLVENDELTARYSFIVNETESGEYNYSKPQINPVNIIKMKAFIIDFGNNGFYEIQSLPDSGLNQDNPENQLHLQTIFNNLVQGINHYYPGEHKRPIPFFNAQNESNEVAYFEDCPSKINNKALQLIVAHSNGNLKNDGSSYPISKFYPADQDPNEVATDIAATIKTGDMKHIVLKEICKYVGEGNTFIDLSSSTIIMPTHLKGEDFVMQENNNYPEPNGKYKSSRAIVVYCDDPEYQQYNNAVLFSANFTTGYDSHTSLINDFKVFYFGNYNDSTPTKFYVSETVAVSKENTFKPLALSCIPTVQYLVNYLQNPENNEKEWKKDFANEISDFNNTADATLQTRTQLTSLNVDLINNSTNDSNSNVNSPSRSGKSLSN